MNAIAHLERATDMLRRAEKWHRHPHSGMQYLEQTLRLEATKSIEGAVECLRDEAHRGIIFAAFGKYARDDE